MKTNLLYKTANAIMAFAVLLFALLLAPLSFANIPSHHFGSGNSLYGFCDFAQNDSNCSPGVGWDETKWNPSIKHDRKSKTLGYASLSQPTLRTKTTDSLGAVIDVGYDRVGNRTSERNGLGETTTYTVDPRGRRTGVSYAGGTGSASYTWDLANRIRTTTENAITTTNSYDALSVNNRAVGWDGTKWNPSF